LATAPCPLVPKPPLVTACPLDPPLPLTHSVLHSVLHSASLPQPLSVAAEQTREQQRLRKRMADAGKNAAKTLLEQIEVSFSAAQKPMSSLVHPQKPGLKAVEITPVLPGFGMWGDNFAIMSFDNDPDDDVPKVEGGGKRDVGQAVLMASQMEEKEDDE
jgi:hypothetical protein